MTVKFFDNVYSAFAFVRKQYRPSTLAVLTGFLGENASEALTKIGVKNVRLVFGMDTSRPRLRESLVREIKKLGLRGFEVRMADGIHAKVYLFDKRVVLIGSANLSRSGFETLQEAMLATNDRKVVLDAQNLFERIWRHARPTKDAQAFHAKKGSRTEETIGSSLGLAHHHPLRSWFPNKKRIVRRHNQIRSLLRESQAAYGKSSVKAYLREAQRNGVGTAFRVLHAAAKRHGFYPRLCPTCIQYAPDRDKRHMLFTVWTEPDTDGRLEVYTYPQHFAKFYPPIRSKTVIKILGRDGWLYMTISDAKRFAKGIERLFSESH